MTGVYPGYHGVVANTIYDPSADIKVSLQRDFPLNGQERWWNRSDPIWVVAKNNGLKTAAYFWPGSDISTRNPDYWLKYNQSVPFEDRVDTIIKWQLEQKLDFTCGYFSEPDSSGHEFGPDSKEYMDAVSLFYYHTSFLLLTLSTTFALFNHQDCQNGRDRGSIHEENC